MPRNKSGLLAAAVMLVLAGCSADHLNRRDQVTLAGGDAVHANLERQTINPSHAAMYDTRGLGRNGGVIPKESAPAINMTTFNITTAPAAESQP